MHTPLSGLRSQRSFYTEGTSFARYAIAKALADRSSSTAEQLMRNRWGMKADVPAADTPNYAGLVESDATIEFWEAVAERSVIGRMGVRSVGFNTRLVTSDQGPTASWTVEGAAKKVSESSFTATALPPRKVCSLMVFTEELLQAGNAETWVRGDMLKAVAAAVDTAFLDPNNAGDDATPASVTNGVSAETATADVAESLAMLVSAFAGDLTRAFVVGHPVTFAKISGVEYPAIGARGGEVAGIPAVATRSCPADVFVLVDPDGLAVAGGAARIKASREGTLEMSDAPTQESTGGSPEAPTASQVVSLWQTNSVGVLVEVATNWTKVRPGSVAVLDTSAWLGSPPLA